MVPTSSANAGLRSPSSSSSYLYDGASHGALVQFHDGDKMDEAYHHPLVRRPVHVLRYSPARRLHALKLVASGRRTEVTRQFLLALTSGYGGMAPIDMKAHDPVTYVGDMLAFAFRAFRAFRVEGELVKKLLLWDDKDGDGDGEGGRRRRRRRMRKRRARPRTWRAIIIAQTAGLTRLCPCRSRVLWHCSWSVASFASIVRPFGGHWRR
jgi:hypothetical protein